MSSTEFHRGKARKIVLDGELSLEEKVKELKKRGFVFEYDDVEGDEFIDIACDRLVYLHEAKEFYELLEHHENRDAVQHLAVADKNSDGTINFILQFYNGGCGFDEVFEDAIKKNEKETEG